MISRNEFDAYNKAVEQIGSKAASDVESSVLNWCTKNPAASVAEKREAAKLIMEGYVQGYDDIASEFAAEWYDHRAKSEGISLDQAITMAVYSPEKSDAVARYQARKLAKGGDAAFAKACGEYARNDAFRSLNETIIANAGRDKDKGVRFARVPTGFETCTFCLMLASRGAVYYSRKTAGEWRHFHRNCDCKVVPGFEKDPLAELVEGHNPKAEYRIWKRVSDARESLKVAYSVNPGDLAEERNRLDKLLDDAWSRHKALGDNLETYRAEYASVVEEACGSNFICIEDFTKIEGKELQEAIWLAKSGHSIEFRNPNDHKGTDGNTSDVLVDGVTCDFKKIESKSRKKMMRRITEKLGKQGPAFLVDLSGNEIKKEEAEILLSRLLDDDMVETIYLVKKGEIETLRK